MGLEVALNVTAVIVTYHPPAGLENRIEAVLAQVERLIVVDNRSDASTQTLLATMAQRFPYRMELILNTTNHGLAAALNQGITRALAHSAEWLLLLDHDSTPTPHMISTMIAAYNVYPTPHRIGLVAPEIIAEQLPIATRYLEPRWKYGFRRALLSAPYNDCVTTVITSGSLISTVALQTIGLMPEHFFIDYVDHEFCLRLRQSGYRLLLVKNAKLLHRIGAKQQHRWLGLRMVSSHHDATRRFYIFRNRLWVWKRYGAHFPHFVVHDALAALFDIIRIILFEHSKRQKLGAIYSGIRAGLSREPL